MQKIYSPIYECMMYFIGYYTPFAAISISLMYGLSHKKRMVKNKAANSNKTTNRSSSFMDDENDRSAS